MQENVSIVITMIVFVILLVIFPLYNYFERQDDMSYNLALKEATVFVDDVLNKGYLTRTMYDKLSDSLARTGNSYDIELEAQRRILTKDPNSPSSDTFIEQKVVDYSKDINETLTAGGTYTLNEGDEVYIKLKNSNVTPAGAIFSSIVPNATNDKIAVNYGGVVKQNKWKEEETNQVALKDVNISMYLVGNQNGSINRDPAGVATFYVERDNLIHYRITVENAIESNVEQILRNNIRLIFTYTTWSGATQINEIIRMVPTITKSTTNQNEWEVVFDLSTFDRTKYFYNAFVDHYYAYVNIPGNILTGETARKNPEINADQIIIATEEARY